MARLTLGGQGAPIPLFLTASDTNNFTKLGGGAMPWTLTPSNTLAVVPGTGSIASTQSFGDFILHAEFLLPPTGNGNCGIYLQGRYEVQIYNSFGKSVTDSNDCGAIWGQIPPSTNACRPAGQWQTYDITFHQPQWNGNTKFAPARATVVLNGVTVQQDVPIISRTTGGSAEGPTPGPVVLQDNGTAVQFRNVNIIPLDTPPEFVWAQRAGSTNAAGNNNDFGKGVKVDANGNVYVTGNFSGTADFGGTNVTAAGSVDFFLAKYDANGTLLWVFKGGGTGFDEGLDIALDPAGNPVVTGIFTGPATFGTNVLVGFGGQDIFLARFTAGGQLVWIQAMGGPALDNGHGVAVDANGDIFLTGAFNQTATFGGAR